MPIVVDDPGENTGVVRLLAQIRLLRQLPAAEALEERQLRVFDVTLDDEPGR